MGVATGGADTRAGACAGNGAVATACGPPGAFAVARHFGQSWPPGPARLARKLAPHRSQFCTFMVHPVAGLGLPTARPFARIHRPARDRPISRRRRSS